MELPTIELMIIKNKKHLKIDTKSIFPPILSPYIPWSIWNSPCSTQQNVCFSNGFFRSSPGVFSNQPRVVKHNLLVTQLHDSLVAALDGVSRYHWHNHSINAWWQKTWQVVVFFPRFPRFSLNERGGSFRIWNDPTTFLDIFGLKVPTVDGWEIQWTNEKMYQKTVESTACRLAAVNSMDFWSINRYEPSGTFRNLCYCSFARPKLVGGWTTPLKNVRQNGFIFHKHGRLRSGENEKNT